MDNSIFDLDEVINYVNDFDKKNINTIFLFMSGRTGSVLFQSILDSHPQVICLPPILSIYNTWDYFYSSSIDKNKIVLMYLKFIELSFASDSYEYMGENKNKSANDYNKLLEDFLIKVVNKIDVFNRKNFLLALSFVYAKLLGYDLSKVKYILIHQHHFIENYNLPDYENNKELAKKVLSSINSDFKNNKKFVTIRNPFHLYKSHLNFMSYNQIIHIPSIYSTLLNQILFSLFFLLEFKNEFRLIKFEDMHKKNDIFIRDLCNDLEIDICDSLFQTTLLGDLWWGSSPSNNPVLGINKNLDYSKKSLVLDSKSKEITSLLFDPIVEHFDYLKLESCDYSLFNEKELIKNEFESLIYLIFKEFEYIDQVNSFHYSDKSIYFSSNIFSAEKHPIIKKHIFNMYTNNYIKNDLFNEDEIIEINSIKFFIKNIFRDKFLYPEKGAFILFSAWDNGFLPTKSVFDINKLVDQVWVPNSFLKDIYIESGVIEDKISVIPLFINNGNVNDIYSVSSNYKIKYFDMDNRDEFKFLIISDMTKDSGVDLLLDSYRKMFYNNKNVLLILVDTSESRETLFYVDNTISENTKKEVNLFVKNKSISKTWFNTLIENFRSDQLNPKVEIFSGELFGYDFNDIYEKSDCFVYPFRYDVLGKRVLESLSKGITVITNNIGSVTDFSNDENSYLINSSISDLELDIVDGIKLSGNKIEILPDIEHLNFLMKYAYDNPEETKSKGKKAKEYIENNFNWNSTFNLVYENIENLRDKPIFRYDFLNKKEELDLEIDTHIKNNDYESAELILLDLINYDISYMYKISDVLMKQDKYEEALDYLTQILDYEGLSYSLCIMIANCLEKTGDIETSMEYYNKSKDLIS